jgi:CspA family cold shock protein
MSSDTMPSRLIGQVKWFNNKAGFGFITVSDGDHAGKDIFVHFSTIHVTNSQYKYLIQGEYIEFDLASTPTDKHEFQATNVSGIKGGALMCETRQNARSTPRINSTPRVLQRANSTNATPRGLQRTNSTPRGPPKDDDEFITVRRRKPASKTA